MIHLRKHVQVVSFWVLKLGAHAPMFMVRSLWRSAMRYFLQSYSVRNGRLEQGLGQYIEARDQALLAAERIAHTRAGVVVMTQDCDLFGEARGPMKPIATFGRVPGAPAHSSARAA